MLSDDEKQLIAEEGKFLLDLGYSVNMEDKRMVRFVSSMYRKWGESYDVYKC